MSWTAYAAVFALFFLSHSLPVRPRIKGWIVTRIGQGGFGAGYSLLSIVMLGWLIWAAGKAPYVELWPQMIWQRHLVLAGMLAVCLIAALSIARPNPFSFGGANNAAFEPEHAGIVRWLRHPLLVALALWAGLHLLPNGDLAHVILFGVLGSFAVLGGMIVNRRKRRIMGAAAMAALEADLRAQPLFLMPRSWAMLGLRLALGLGAYLGLLWLHPVVIGVPAL